MIEVIYDKKDEKTGKTRTEKEAMATLHQETDVKLPKNIRQIGTPPSNKRIYIEDYVVTFLNYIARPGSTRARGAVLLGEVKESQIGTLIFISGAVEAENLEFDMDESEFTQEAWAGIYEKVKEFFPDLTVVGWFLSRMGFSTAINRKIEKLHVDNFPGKDKVLYVTDSLESDEAFYMYEHGQLLKQKGYYIYYERNEVMQNYIVAQKGDESEECDTTIKRNDEAIIKSFREKNSNLHATKGGNINFTYIASSFLVLGMLALGVSVVNNSDKMKQMEVDMNRLQLTAEDVEHGPTEVISIQDAEVILAVDDSQTTNEPVSDNENSNTLTTEVILEQTTEQATTEQVLPASTNGSPTYYTICYGDSLMSIALSYYGSVVYANDIANANAMGIDDPIYEGQTLILPSVSAH